MGGAYYKNVKWKYPRKVLSGNFIIKDQLENQEKDGRTSSGGTHHTSQEYQDGGNEH
jgi:hypothetical protein